MNDSDDIGRLVDRSFRDAAEAMRRFAVVWNNGHAAPVAPILSRIQASLHRKKGDGE